MVIRLKDSNTFVTSPKTVAKLLQDLLAAEDEIDRDKEHFWVFHLDNRLKIKLLELISLGTLTSSLVHPREVFTRAIAERSAKIIIAHNHPSDEAAPSEDDIISTKRLAKAGKIVGIELLDHIIVTSNSFMSFKEKSLL